MMVFQIQVLMPLKNLVLTSLPTNVAQEQLENYINKENISVILVRSATTVRKGSY
jgi:hypothetical protein